MTTTMTRREMLKAGLTAASLAAMGLPVSALPALAQGETAVPFTDIPDNLNFNWDGQSPNRIFDIRTIDAGFTPKDKFFAIQHLAQPEIDGATYRLKMTGLINKPIELALDDLKKHASVQLPAGFECSGNGP